MFIYKITNTENNKIYIGKTTKTIQKRFKKHILDAKYQRDTFLCRSILKYGPDKFTVEEVCQCETDKELDDMETYYINLFESYKRNIGYNLTMGGEGMKPNKITSQRLKDNWNPICGKNLINGENKKSIIQLDLKGKKLAEFESITKAGELLNIDFRSISAVCNGRRKTTSGYKFKFK